MAEFEILFTEFPILVLQWFRRICGLEEYVFLCGDVLYIQIKKWYVKFGATGSLSTLV